MFDTHCHLNFRRFEGLIDRVIQEARKQNVHHILVPGTDLNLSKKALQIAHQYEGVYAAVGIHPHHLYRISQSDKKNVDADLKKTLHELEQLLQDKKAVAIGEIGIDRHEYQTTVYQKYTMSPEFIALQKDVLKTQIEMGICYHKAIILHNREAVDDVLQVIQEAGADKLSHRCVFHCCEPDERLLSFARKNHYYIGVDGDVTYNKDKEVFIQQVPLDLLVLETDSPYLLPEPLRSQRLFPNTPSNIPLIAEAVARIKEIPLEHVIQMTTENAMRLFGLTKK